MTEPDLLIVFTPMVVLKGYPPWQIRLTELLCVSHILVLSHKLTYPPPPHSHVQDNNGVGYQVFLRALYKYAKAEMRLGR